MKIIKKFGCSCAAMLFLLGLAACEKDPVVPSSALPVSSAPVVSETSSQPESESSWFVPAGDLIPDGVQEGTEGFEGAFSQNPIDKKYDADYRAAMSFSSMRQACDQAADAWKKMVDSAYDDAVAVLSGEERSTLQAEQDVWRETLDGELKKIAEENGDSNDGILETARRTVLFYRARAKELCQIKYEADGALPSFPEE